MAENNKTITFSAEIDRRLRTPVNESIPLKDRLDLPRLRAALKQPLFMDSFLDNKDDLAAYEFPIPTAAFNSCGTIGCIAGNAVLNEFPPRRRYERDVYDTRSSYGIGGLQTMAALILRLSEPESSELFTVAFPASTPGTPAYAAEVTSAVKDWLATYDIELEEGA